MKKITIFVLLVISMFLFVGCNSKKNERLISIKGQQDTYATGDNNAIDIYIKIQNNLIQNNFVTYDKNSKFEAYDIYNINNNFRLFNAYYFSTNKQEVIFIKNTEVFIKVNKCWIKDYKLSQKAKNSLDEFNDSILTPTSNLAEKHGLNIKQINKNTIQVKTKIKTGITYNSIITYNSKSQPIIAKTKLSNIPMMTTNYDFDDVPSSKPQITLCENNLSSDIETNKS